jgi:hypothetical protein
MIITAIHGALKEQLGKTQTQHACEKFWRNPTGLPPDIFRWL